jgi:hypothetical protein
VLYLLDASVLITAANTYYPVDQVPEFWEWIQFQGSAGNIKMPIEIMEEILAGKKDDDPLLTWIKDPANKQALLLDETVDPDLVNLVVESGYADDLKDDEIEELGRDPFLIAYGLAGNNDRCIVTTEVSSPGKKRQNRKIPDVCAYFGLNSCALFRVNRDLGFKTGWKS